MKKYLITILFLFSLFGIKTAFAKEYGTTVPIPGSVHWPPPNEISWGGYTPTSWQIFGQDFWTRSYEPQMDGIELYMKIVNGCPASGHELTLSLYEGRYYETDTFLASTSMSSAECQAMLDGDYQWYEFHFPQTVSVAPSTRHHFRLHSGDFSDGERYWHGYFVADYLGNSGVYYYLSDGSRASLPSDVVFRTYTGEAEWKQLVTITDPVNGAMKIIDMPVTVSGTCPTNGPDRLALTTDCSSFANLTYDIDCVNGEFNTSYYYDGSSDFIAIVEADSVAGDCVDYDDYMDVIQIDGIEVIEGYPDDWFFNYNYYDDFDIVINSPAFVDALTLPIGSTNVDISFKFVFPMPLSPNVTFHIKQYDQNGNLLNADYHTETLVNMSDTNNYIVNFTASTSPLHYVVQLFNGSELSRQFPFGIYVSDLDFTHNPDDYKFFFPRLVEKLRQKIIFNYFFGFYDSFYNLFSATGTPESAEALDVSFVAMSDDGQYDLEVPILKGSDPSVKSFAQGMRPYIIAFLWIGFAVYVFLRVAKMFESDE